MGDKPRVTMDAQTEAAIRADGWQNLLSGAGTPRDPGESTRPTAENAMRQQEMDDVYRGDGIGRRVVDLPAEEMTRQWVRIDGQRDDERKADLSRLRAKQQFNRALRWAGLYGGSVVLMLANDGQADLSEPLNDATLRSIDDLIVYDRHQTTWSTAEVSHDPRNTYFGRAEWLTIQPTGGVPFPVHRSRLLVFDGEDVPDRIRQRNSGWGDSRLQSVYRALGRYAEGMSSTSSILRDFILPVLSMSNLSDMIANGQEDVVRKRLEILGVSRSVLNVLLIDAEEESYEKKASSVSGIDKLLAELRHNIAACTGIPQTKLFGVSPQGMNATGESDTRGWYDSIASEQEDKLMPNLTRLVYLLDATDGGEPGDRLITPEPLWQMDAKQKAEIRKMNTESAVMALDYQIIEEETAKDWIDES